SGRRASSATHDSAVAAAKPDTSKKPAITTTLASTAKPDSAAPKPVAASDSGTPKPAVVSPASAPKRALKPPVIIDGLTVDSVTQFAAGGTTGYRVVQTLDSGEHITLSAVPVAGAQNPPAAEEVRIDSLPGDTAVATVRFEGFVVNARGVIA